LREFMEARICVERTTVRLAVSRSGQKDVARLRSIIGAMKRASESGDVSETVRQDVAFHMELARMSGNRVLHKFLQTTWGMLHKFVAEVGQLPGAFADAVRFHSEITAAVAAKDTDKAELEMLRHLVDVVQRIERNLNVDLDVGSLFEVDRMPAKARPSLQTKARRSKRQ